MSGWQRWWLVAATWLSASGFFGCGDDGQASGAGGGGAAGGTDPGGAAQGGQASQHVAAAEETVTIQNDYGTLEGTLLLPESDSPPPVVLILSGSGSGDRDGDKPQMYKQVAEALLAEGIGSLRYDDHGIGGSVTAAPAKVEDFSFEIEITDAARWVGSLRKDVRVGHVIVAGHSQGSLTGILAANSAPIDGFISLAGAGRPVAQILHEQLADDLTASQLAELDAALATMEAGELAGPLAPPLDQILPVEVQPYLISWLKYDPKAEIAKLDAPALIAQGEVDVQVTVGDAELLHDGLPSSELLLIPDMCHVLKQATASNASQQKAYNDPSVPLAPELIPALTTFILDLP